MYASNHFDKKEMTEWENKPVAIKDDFDKAKLYFQGLVKDYKVALPHENSEVNVEIYRRVKEEVDFVGKL